MEPFRDPAHAIRQRRRESNWHLAITPRVSKSSHSLGYETATAVA